MKYKIKTIELETVNSTNIYIKNNLSLIKSDNILLTAIAKEQKSGYGRNQNIWQSPKNGLWFSFAFRLNDSFINKIAGFSHVTSLTISKILENDYKIFPKIKWPNDILINQNKLAGILIEIKSFLGEKILITGIGINTNFKSSILKNQSLKLRPVSTFDLLKTNIDNSKFMKKIINKLLNNFNLFLSNGYQYFKRELVERDCLINTYIKVKLTNSELKGTVKGYTDEGFLILRDDNFNEKIIYSGEIIIL